MTLLLAITITPAAAAGDAVSAVSNLTSFIYTILRAFGGLMIAYGILQIGMSFQAHDPAQRTQGILVAVGGIIIAFAEQIVNTITGG